MFSPRRGLRLAFTDTARSQFRSRLFTVEILFTIVLTRSRMKGEGGSDSPAGRDARVLRARDAPGGYPHRKSPRGLYWSARRYLNDEHQHERLRARSRAPSAMCHPPEYLWVTPRVICTRARARAHSARGCERIRIDGRQGSPGMKCDKAHSPPPSLRQGKPRIQGIVNIAHRLADAIGYGASRTQRARARVGATVFYLFYLPDSRARARIALRARSDRA